MIFFHNQASDLENCGAGNSTVLFDEKKEEIVGFYTLSFKSLNIRYLKRYSKFDALFLNDFINPLGIEDFPVLEIQRFGVVEEMQRKKIGATMMATIYKDVLTMRLEYNLPINSIYVDALYEATEFYQALGFEFITFSDDEERLNLYPMMISLEKIGDIVYSSGI
ncbi:MAG TPA: GNAT family N-acetyltransferase [Candidatus Tetragenococcus pullicola]|nr:GNAT family N-acetyltransferase [Candidatus Tetragenococcus pullicola]